MNYYDRLMLEYYRVLNNAWKRKIKDAAYCAIMTLSAIPKHERVDHDTLDVIVDNANQQLGPEFAQEVAIPTKNYVERSMRLGLADAQKDVSASISIGLWGPKEQQITNSIINQNLQWIGQHFGADIQEDMRKVLTESFDKGLTTQQLAEKLKETFSDIEGKSAHYWQGLAEHTALRIREYGRLEGYQKAGAKYYRLVNPMDERTSDICWALVSAGKVYPLQDAIEIRNEILGIDVQSLGLDAARERLKELAPWVKNSQVQYDPNGKPVSIVGAHTPFPPFHWRCRTTTEIV